MCFLKHIILCALKIKDEKNVPLLNNLAFLYKLFGKVRHMLGIIMFKISISSTHTHTNTHADLI